MKYEWVGITKSTQRWIYTERTEWLWVVETRKSIIESSTSVELLQGRLHVRYPSRGFEFKLKILELHANVMLREESFWQYFSA